MRAHRPAGKPGAQPVAQAEVRQGRRRVLCLRPEHTIPERAIAYRAFNGMAPNAPVPADAVTASGSGLDPDISVANALDQAPRVARSRHLPVTRVIALVHRHTQGRQWGFLSEPAINVLGLNLALDGGS